MTERICICLSCGNKMNVAFKDDFELRDKLCPFCGSNNLVKYNANGFFTMLFGGLGNT
jgi:DNA-directed RNA polymerase subunit RPC12/RpoP